MLELMPPIKGVSTGLPVDKESPITSGYMNNVRPTDVLENKIRLGQRLGIGKWGSGTLVGGANNPIVAFCVVAAIV